MGVTLRGDWISRQASGYFRTSLISANRLSSMSRKNAYLAAQLRKLADEDLKTLGRATAILEATLGNWR
jgi:hypothetical protein